MAYPLLIRKPRSAPQVRCLPNAAMSMPTTPMQWSSAKSSLPPTWAWALPSRTARAKRNPLSKSLALLQYPDGVDFGDEKAYLIFGIAGVGDAHLDLLAHVCEVLEDEEALEMMKKTPDIKFVLTHLQ